MAKPRVHFQAALDGLREQFLDIARNVEEIIDLAVRCYFLQAPALGSDALSIAQFATSMRFCFSCCRANN
jgi:hypothetical protein